MTGPWISDTAEEIEHPTVPLGINRMAIPRAAILLSLSMIALIFISTLVVGYSAWKFLDMNQDAFDATDRSLIQDPESREVVLGGYSPTIPAIQGKTIGVGLTFCLNKMTSSFCQEKCAVIGSTKEKAIGPRQQYTIEAVSPSTLSSRLSGARSFLEKVVSRISR